MVQKKSWKEIIRERATQKKEGVTYRNVFIEKMLERANGTTNNPFIKRWIEQSKNKED